MVKEFIEAIDNLCYCYIHCNLQKEYIEASAIHNLRWIENQSGIQINNNEIGDFSISDYIDYCLNKIAELIYVNWSKISQRELGYNESNQTFVYTYQGLYHKHYNGKRIVFQLFYQNGVLHMLEFEDEINPDSNYGFSEFPVKLYQPNQ